MGYNTIGFIGAGNMATAIIKGLIKSGMFKPEQIYASARTQKSLDKISEDCCINTSLHNSEVAKKADIIVLAIKPFMFAEVLPQIASEIDDSKLVISIAAGKSMAQISELLGKDCRIIRSMLNTPALVGEAMSALCVNEKVSEEDKAFGLKMFESFGEAEYISETLMDAVVGVSGSSPAYVYMFIEALADAAVADGMPRAQAYKFAAQSVLGSAKMVLETGTHPGALKDAVCSPGGTTIEAVASLEKNGFRSAIIEAARACTAKSKQL